MRKVCNYCDNLQKNYNGNCVSIFKALCRACTNSNGDPKLIEVLCLDHDSIERPEWCPKNGENALSLPQPSNVKHEYTYSEKRTMIMQFPRNINWDDIKEGHLYVIPKVLYTPMKIVRVESIDSVKAKCKELSIEGLKETYTSVYIYPNDIDAIVMAPLRSF